MKAPAIAAEIAVAANDAMAGDDDGDGVGGAGSGDGTGCARIASRGRNLRVGLGAAGRDGLQIVPDLHLKSGGADVEREIDARLLAVKIAG